jgi:hypothetical protein
MLAVYGADANALQRMTAGLGRTDLYGRLIEEFARREVNKHFGALADDDLESAVEPEILRLSVTAFAMFNRRSLWVSILISARIFRLATCPLQDRREQHRIRRRTRVSGTIHEYRLVA